MNETFERLIMLLILVVVLIAISTYAAPKLTQSLQNQLVKASEVK